MFEGSNNSGEYCEDISMSFVLLVHPDAVRGFEWRRTGRYMPRLLFLRWSQSWNHHVYPQEFDFGYNSKLQCKNTSILKRRFCMKRTSERDLERERGERERQRGSVRGKGDIMVSFFPRSFWYSRKRHQKLWITWQTFRNRQNIKNAFHWIGFESKKSWIVTYRKCVQNVLMTWCEEHTARLWKESPPPESLSIEIFSEQEFNFVVEKYKKKGLLTKHFPVKRTRRKIMSKLRSLVSVEVTYTFFMLSNFSNFRNRVCQNDSLVWKKMFW